MKISTIVIGSLLALSAGAFAQTPSTETPRVDKREAKQEQRIYKGIASGELTQKETARLNNGQDRVENAEAKAKSDGTVTGKERAHLAHMQNKQSRHIYKQKHDRQATPAAAK